jgi:hypothetical protein
MIYRRRNKKVTDAEENSKRQTTEELKKLYPDYRPEDTFVVKRNLLVAEEDGNLRLLDYSAVRGAVKRKYGEIIEDVVPQDKAELLGVAYFRVKKPDWWVK